MRSWVGMWLGQETWQGAPKRLSCQRGSFSRSSPAVDQPGDLRVVVLDQLPEDAAVADPLVEAELAHGDERVDFALLVALGHDLAPLAKRRQVVEQLRAADLAEEDRQVFSEERADRRHPGRGARPRRRARPPGRAHRRCRRPCRRRRGRRESSRARRSRSRRPRQCRRP